jgi:hypothetical protein
MQNCAGILQSRLFPAKLKTEGDEAILNTLFRALVAGSGAVCERRCARRRARDRPIARQRSARSTHIDNETGLPDTLVNNVDDARTQPSNSFRFQSPAVPIHEAPYADISNAIGYRRMGSMRMLG